MVVSVQSASVVYICGTFCHQPVHLPRMLRKWPWSVTKYVQGPPYGHFCADTEIPRFRRHFGPEMCPNYYYNNGEI